MAKLDSWYETTVRAMQGEDGRFRFARSPRAIGDRLLQFVLPVLWLLALVVLVAALWW
jgi:hypothetical protein